MSFDKIGYTIHAIENVLAASLATDFRKQQADPERCTAYSALVDSIGDGNCGPRSIIQGLLLLGLLHNQQEFVYQTLHNLYSRNCDNLLPYEDYTSYAALPNDPRYPVGQGSVRLPLSQKQGLEEHVIHFLNTYRTLQATPQSLAYVQNIMPLKKYGPERRRPQHDYILYLLAAYLRFDVAAYCHQTKVQRPTETGKAQTRFDRLQDCLDVADEDMLGDFERLEINTNLQITGGYFSEQNIHLQVYSELGDRKVACLYDNQEDCDDTPSHINLAIYKIPRGSHYATLINPEVDRLQPVHSQQVSKKAAPEHPQFLLSAFGTFHNRFLVCILFSACCMGAGYIIGGTALPIGIGIASVAVLGFFAKEYMSAQPTPHNAVACIH